MAYARKQSSSNNMNRSYMNENCQLNEAFEVFNGRWTPQIIFCIHFELNRFGLIKNRLPGISDQILGLRLNHLVDNKIVIKKEVAGEKLYSLSEKGVALIHIFEQIVEWQTGKCSPNLF